MLIALSAHFLRGSSKCVQKACRGREGVKKGQKTACAFYVWPHNSKCKTFFALVYSGARSRKVDDPSKSNDSEVETWELTNFNGTNVTGSGTPPKLWIKVPPKETEEKQIDEKGDRGKGG